MTHLSGNSRHDNALQHQDQPQATGNEKMSRRALLATLGTTGVAVAASGLFSSSVAKAVSGESTVTGSVYGGEGCDLTIDADCVNFRYTVDQPVRTVGDRLRETISVKDFGAKGDGVTDDTSAFVAAFAWANSLKYTGLVSTIIHPGATVYIPDGIYNLQTISTPIDVMCNVTSYSPEVLIPQAYASSVFRVGLTTVGSTLAGAVIELPQIRKPVNAAMVAGSIGIQLINLNVSKVYLKGIQYFETAVSLTGLSQGVVYCEIHIGQIITCQRALVLAPGSGGWVNSNQFFGGTISQSPGYAGIRTSGWRHIIMDGRSPGTSVVGNTFIGLSLEGNASEYLVEAYNAYRNTFIGTYHETGAPKQSVTLSGDTFTQVGHGRVVGDLVAFQASVTPTGMILAAPYYITNVPTSDTFKVSPNKGGTAQTFGSAGTNVTYILAARCLFDSTGGTVIGNRFEYTLTPPSILIDFIETGLAEGNGKNDYRQHTLSAYLEEDVPLYRARNSSGSATSRPAFAAYPTTVNPTTQPKLWTTAIGDRGVLWAANGAELGRLFNTGGILSYQVPGGIAYEVASCRRSPTLIAVSHLLAANTTTSLDITLTGATTNDHVLVTPQGVLPTGVVYSHAYVVSADTLRVVFYNFTGSSISLSVNLQAVVFKRFV